MNFFWIAAFVANIAVDKPNGIKTLSANGVSTFFINGKPTVINGRKKLRNPPSCLIIYVVASFNKIFSEDLIILIISFISLFVKVVPSPFILFTICSSILFILFSTLNKNPPDCILDNWVFENFILADERFAKTLRVFETCVPVDNNLCEKSVSLLQFLVKFDERFKVTPVPFIYSRF